MASMLTDLNIAVVREETARIKNLIQSQYEILAKFKGDIDRMSGNWGGTAYQQYTQLGGKVAPESKNMLSKVESLNNAMIKLLDKLEQADRSAAGKINNV